MLPRGPVPIDTGTVELVRRPGDPDGVLVLVNGAESSHLDLADPARLEFEYMQQMVEVVDACVSPDAPLRALHLGGAGCALPRALDARRPGSRQTAVEVDATLAHLARDWFDLPRSPRLRLRVQDARAAVQAARPGSLDLVVRDVFDGASTPPHVRTAEFTTEVARALRPGGLYLVNVVDKPPLAATRRESATLGDRFSSRLLIAEPGVVKGRRFGNAVLAGTDGPLPVAALARRLRRLPIPVSLLTGDELDAFTGRAAPFTDPQTPEGGPRP